MLFDNPTEIQARNAGVQRVYKFDNGYGASVVCSPYSYGGRSGLWELAVLDSDGQLCYSTSITDDVLGWLTEEEANKLLKKIRKLSK